MLSVQDLDTIDAHLQYKYTPAAVLSQALRPLRRRYVKTAWKIMNPSKYASV
jgi:hypothetical protein